MTTIGTRLYVPCIAIDVSREWHPKVCLEHEATHEFIVPSRDALEIPEILHEMASRILAQDNLATADPVFMVQQRRRVYGFDPVFDDGGHTVWLNDEGHEVPQDELETMWKEDSDIDLTTGSTPNTTTLGNWLDARAGDFNLTETAYQDFWDNVQPFFTKIGADQYIQANAHRMTDPRVYVESAYRNPEWLAIRALLQQLAKAQR